MTVFAGPFHIAALVLVISGVDKLSDPTASTQAMVDAGVVPRGRRWRSAGRALGLVELVVGAAAIAIGGPLSAVAVAVVYLGFGAFVVRLRRRAGDAPCGCFGASSSPPGGVHNAVNGLGAAAALAALSGDAPALLAVGDPGVAELVAYGVVVASGSALVVAATSLAEQVRTAVKELRT